jgi:hypothetical protein
MHFTQFLLVLCAPVLEYGRSLAVRWAKMDDPCSLGATVKLISYKQE